MKDLNVLPAFQRQGIASHLMDEAEAIVARRCAEIGIGVGMDMDYGPAQRMYILRGYVPDGRGLTVDGRQLRYAESVRVDDDLVLFLTKRLDTT